MSPDKMNTCSTPTPTDVVEAARGWLNVRWVHQGRSRAGIDCAGLLIKVLSELSLPVEDMQGYRRSPDGLAFLNHIRRQTLPTTGMAPGTIAIFRQSVMPCHTGFFAERDGRTTLIHAYMTSGKVVEEIFDHEWPRLLIEARAINGLTY